jgi:hypothetical protein
VIRYFVEVRLADSVERWRCVSRHRAQELAEKKAHYFRSGGKVEARVVTEPTKLGRTPLPASQRRVRIDMMLAPETLERLDALRGDGETRTAVVERLICEAQALGAG